MGSNPVGGVLLFWWANSSVGRAPASHVGGHRFKSCFAHFFMPLYLQFKASHIFPYCKDAIYGFFVFLNDFVITRLPPHCHCEGHGSGQRFCHCEHPKGAWQSPKTDCHVSLIRHCEPALFSFLSLRGSFCEPKQSLFCVPCAP